MVDLGNFIREPMSPLGLSNGQGAYWFRGLFLVPRMEPFSAKSAPFRFGNHCLNGRIKAPAFCQISHLFLIWGLLLKKPMSPLGLSNGQGACWFRSLVFFAHSCGTVFGEISIVPVREPLPDQRIEVHESDWIG